MLTTEMRILIDEGLSALTKLTGIGHYSRELAKHLKGRVEKVELTNYFYLKVLPRVFRRYSYLCLSNLNALKGFDVIHFTNYYVPPFKLKPRYIVTLHDFTPFVLPEALPKSYLLYIINAMRVAITKADGIIVFSEYAKVELQQYLNFHDLSRVHVCYNGVRDTFLKKRKAPIDQLQMLGLTPFKYLLFVGTLEKRKNITWALKIFKTLNLKDIKFALIGKPGPGFEEIKCQLDHKSVIYFGYLEDEKLVAAYDYAIAFVFPSLYEGFGIPLVEAMARNVPIIAANIPTNLELNSRHNNQFFIFELGDADNFVYNVLTLVSNFDDIRSTLDYGDLSMYDWRNVATQHLKVYKQALK